MTLEKIFEIPQMSADWIRNELNKKFQPDEAEKSIGRLLKPTKNLQMMHRVSAAKTIRCLKTFTEPFRPLRIMNV